MSDHKTGTREEWLAARLQLLNAEKELTRRSDELAQRRQELPWVRIDEEYRFETDQGTASLADLFRGRSQLLIYHFMFGPDYTAGCPSCSSIADGFDGFVVHLANHDVTLSAVSRAPLAKLQAYRRRMGWTFPWASSADTDFNLDFSVRFTEAQQREAGIEYNYRREARFQPRGGEDPVAEMAATIPIGSRIVKARRLVLAGVSPIAISRPAMTRSSSAAQRTPSIARSASVNASVSGLPPSRVICRPRCSRLPSINSASFLRISKRR